MSSSGGAAYRQMSLCSEMTVLPFQDRSWLDGREAHPDYTKSLADFCPELSECDRSQTAHSSPKSERRTPPKHRLKQDLKWVNEDRSLCFQDFEYRRQFYTLTYLAISSQVFTLQEDLWNNASKTAFSRIRFLAAANKAPFRYMGNWEKWTGCR